MKDTYNIATIYNKAPELLLDKMAEVNAVIAKTDPNHKSYKFWKGVMDTMKFAWSYMNDFAWIVKDNERLRAENEFLRSWTRELSERLTVYESIRAEKLAGTFEESVKRVDEFIKNEAGN